MPLLNNAVALGGFVLGAALAARVVRGRDHQARVPSVHLMLMVTTALVILALGLLWLLFGAPTHGWLLGLTAMLAIAMGTQAVSARGARVRDVTTVVITTTLVNFALDSPLAGGTGEKWMRRFGSLLSMGAGGALGALMEDDWSGAGALFVAGACMCVGATALVVARRSEA